MRTFVIGDLHLSGSVDKPMDIFGGRWDNHQERLQENWERVVDDHDTVIIVGDISWAMRLEEVEDDLRFLDCLPGNKILLRGNHDYWWQSLNKNERFCQEKELLTLQFLQNNAIEIGTELIVAGTRLWMFPDDARFTKNDAKILRREFSRLKLSLQDAEKLRKEHALLLVFHYPPFEKSLRSNDLTKCLNELGAMAAVYGHVHHEDSPYCLNQHILDGVPYSLVAADFVQFTPLCIYG